MNIVAAIGFEEAYAWTNIAELLANDGVRVFSPLIHMRELIDEELAIEPDQGDLKRLAVRLRNTIEEEVRDTFWKKFLWDLQEVDRWNAAVAGVNCEHILLLHDTLDLSDIVALRKATTHNVTIIGCQSARASVVDRNYDSVLELEHFCEVICEFLGLRSEEYGNQALEDKDADEDDDFEEDDAFIEDEVLEELAE